MMTTLETSETPPAHILIVEDSDTQAMRLRLYLEANGWNVSRVANGAEARRLIFSTPLPEGAVSGLKEEDFTPVTFDLILLDYNLPDTLGDVLCREIRANPATRIVPVVLLTASEREETELQTLQSGADDYVSKSVPIEVVIARLSTLLQKARARAELSSRYERERRVAQVLQESLLYAPPSEAFPNLSFGMIYESAWDEARVGGDFYDIRSMGEGRVALVVGDVTGKGLEAATFTAEIKYALRALLYEHSDPGQALERLNNFICDSGERNTWTSTACVAIALAVCDTKTGEVQIATAGSEPPLHLHRDGDGNALASELMENHGPLIGVMSGMPYFTSTIQLGKHDVLMMFTDGITEARERGKEMMGYGAMAETARQSYAPPDASMDSIIATVLEEAKRVSGGQLLDDACLLAVRIR